MILDAQKLETLLLANWTEFLDTRQVLKLLGEHTGKQIQNLTISRFELVDQGFLLWFETTANKERMTVEALLTVSGIRILRTDEDVI
jgi:hypothetical protein